MNKREINKLLKKLRIELSDCTMLKDVDSNSPYVVSILLKNKRGKYICLSGKGN